MNYRQTIKYLEGFKRYGIRLGLERMLVLLDLLGNPQNNFRSIHIAGTNGKGSVAAMLSSVLTKAGYRTGLYTSPHLVDYTERIRINEKDVSEIKFAKAVEDVKKITNELPDMQLTEFEVLTASAFLLLSKEKVDIAVIEVGLGGRLDATNVIKPVLSIITNIERDHMDVLGNSLNKIAEEKAGIIKSRVPLVTGESGQWGVLSSICKKQGAKIISARNIKANVVPLAGVHQVENTRVVLAGVNILKRLGFRISDKQLKAGLCATRWPGRLQIVSKNPLILLDGAHNIAGAKALKKYLSGFKRKFTFIIGMQANKEIAAFIRTIKPLAKRFIAVRSGNPSSAPANKVARQIRLAGKRAETAISIKKALEKAKESNKSICITGSLYLVGDVIRQEHKFM